MGSQLEVTQLKVATSKPIVVNMTNVLHDLQRDGVHMTPELVARLSPYLTEHLKRFGHYILDMEPPPASLQPKPLFVTAP